MGSSSKAQHPLSCTRCRWISRAVVPLHYSKTERVPACLHSAGIYFAALPGPSTAALAHGCSHSSSPLPLENSTAGRAAPALLTQPRLSCRSTGAGKPSLPFPPGEKGAQEQPQARLTSLLPRGDEVWFPGPGWGRTGSLFLHTHFPLQD